MASRHAAPAWAVAGLLLLDLGCSLPRAVIPASGPGIDAGTADVGGGRVDTGVPPVDTGVPPVDMGRPPVDTGVPPVDMGIPPVDGGGGCATPCDDGNPCTDDACDASHTCTHTNNAASCDDGVLCNGGDTCAGGTCSVHDGVDPCVSPTHCDVPSDTCMGCTRTSDCPAEVPGDWGTCDFGTDLCATSGGMQTRTVTTYTCNHGTCDSGSRMESQSCTRPTTDGRMCSAPAYGDWSACDFGSDPCTQVGSQGRIVTTSYCGGGTCVATDAPESQSCTRPSTDGTPCATPTTGDWSVCMVGAACATTGTQMRTSTTAACTGGACVTMSTTEMQACMPTSVVGAACGATTCGAWGSCTQTMPGTCDRTGVQTRTCTTPTCAGGGGCTGSSMTTEMQACNANVSGVSCTTTSCGYCRESGRLDCRSGHSGTQRCTTTNGTCMDYGLGPFCGGFGGTTTTRSCMCP